MAFDWVATSAVITALATVALVLFTALLWIVNDRLAKLQHWAEERDSASIAVRILEVKPQTDQFRSSLRFLIENSGLRHTHIREAFLEHDAADGPGKVPLTFIWNKPDYVDHEYGKERIIVRAPFHFAGENLTSGQLWDVEAFVVPRVNIPGLARPRLVVDTVLGGRHVFGVSTGPDEAVSPVLGSSVRASKAGNN